MVKECWMIGCVRKVVARGLCMGHYRRWLRHGDPTFIKVKQGATVCQKRGCKEPRWERAKLALCMVHHREAKAKASVLYRKRHGK